MSVNSNGYTSTLNKKKPLKHYLNNDFDKDFLSRKKMGFAVPLETWIKKELRNEILDTINGENSFLKNEFNHNFLEFFDELDKGNKSYKNRIWKLYVLEKSIQKYKNI